MIVDVRRILFPTDFSEPAQQALKYAMALTERFGSELHLLHVIPPIPTPFPDSSSSLALPADYLTTQADVAKKRFVKELGETWLAEHRTVQAVEEGFAVDEIVRYAKKHDIDMIVVGTHGNSGLSRLLLGSVAEKLVRISDCPVLTVHPKGHSFVSDTASG